MYHILIVEDSRISRSAFERQLEMEQDFLVLASIENAANAEILCMRGKIDLILMDVCTADDESGLDAAARIKIKYPEIKIIIMTSMPEYSFQQKAKAANCDSFWYKEYGTVDLIDICRRTLNGESVWPEETPALRIGLAKSDEFTDRELDVIRTMAQGMKYEEISDTLCMSVNNVKYHIRNILQKTGFHSTVQLVSEVVEKRLILPKY